MFIFLFYSSTVLIIIFGFSFYFILGCKDRNYFVKRKEKKYVIDFLNAYNINRYISIPNRFFHSIRQTWY